MRLVLAPTILFLAIAAWAAPPGLHPGGEARVREVIDGDTVLLDDGAQVRLVGIQAPKLPLGRAGFRAWPLADEAETALEEIVLSKTVSLAYGGARTDRHGRRLAHLHVVGTGSWVQGEMLRRGLARVYTFPDNRALAAEMLERERQAREERRGIWREPFYRILSPDTAGRHVDSFQLIEGRVLAVVTVKGRHYLNFGPDWRTDFTISVGPEASRLFRAANMDLGSLEGRRVRVRGWLAFRNGPSIEATHPEQLELLD